eukprot:COSAG05_NODE_13477_length_428_cov_1.343465_1_plen_142_part_11
MHYTHTQYCIKQGTWRGVATATRKTLRTEKRQGSGDNAPTHFLVALAALVEIAVHRQFRDRRRCTCGFGFTAVPLDLAPPSPTRALHDSNLACGACTCVSSQQQSSVGLRVNSSKALWAYGCTRTVAEWPKLFLHQLSAQSV